MISRYVHNQGLGQDSQSPSSLLPSSKAMHGAVRVCRLTCGSLCFLERAFSRPCPSPLSSEAQVTL